MTITAAAAAEYELELRAERQTEGIAAAKRRQAEGKMLPGKKPIGRPRAIGPAELAALRRLVEDGVSVTEAARTLKIGRSTAYQALTAAADTAPATARTELDAVLATLPADTRPPPSVTQYGQLLTRPPRAGHDWDDGDVCQWRDEGRWGLTGPAGEIEVPEFGLLGALAAGDTKAAQGAAAAAIIALTGRTVTG